VIRRAPSMTSMCPVVHSHLSTEDAIVGDESAITTPICSLCQGRPAHPEAFGLCEACDDQMSGFQELGNDPDDDETHRMVGE
jgi:hypothetical protein